MTMSPDFYGPEVQGAYVSISIGRLDLANGDVLDEARLAVLTIGRMNKDRSNVILVPTWFSGTHAPIRDFWVGENHALDPREYCIVIVNQLGGGLSTSARNWDSTKRASEFPELSIADDVVAQERLVREHLHVESLELVLGASMGAQQTYEWAARFPEMTKRIATVAGTSRTMGLSAVLAGSLRQAIESDPGYAEGDYESFDDVRAGLGEVAHLWALMGYSDRFWTGELLARLGFSGSSDFITRSMEPMFQSRDPNVLRSLATKWLNAGIKIPGLPPEKALEGVKTPALVMAIDSDMFFTVEQIEREHRMLPHSVFALLTSGFGHLAITGIDSALVPQIDEHLTSFLHTR